MRGDEAPRSLAQLRKHARMAERSRLAADRKTLRAMIVVALCATLGLALALVLWLP